MCAAEYVWALVSGLPAGKREQQQLMVLQVYADESGKGHGPVFVIAGWLTDSAAWAAFSTEWQQVLIDPPTVGYFRMGEAWHRQKGEFRGWSVERRDEKISRLAVLIKKYARLGAHLVISHDEYNKKIKGRFAKQHDDPYVLGVYRFIISAIRFFAEQGINESIDFIFDEQLTKTDEMHGFWSEFIQHVPPEYRSLIGSRPVHQNDKKLMPLQAADMLAWHIRREQFEPPEKRIETTAIDIFDLDHRRFVMDVDVLAEILRS
jgi:hypothetical protein